MLLQSWMQLRVRLDRQLRNVCLNFSCFTAGCRASGPHGLQLRNRLDIQLRNVCLIFRVYGWLQSLWTSWTPPAPPLELLEYSAESRDRTGSQHDICGRLDRIRSAALGSSRCELPGMHSVPKSAVLPCASVVGGLSRRLLHRAPYVAAAGHSPSSAMGQTAVPPTPLHPTSVSPRALSGTLSFRRHVFAGNPHHRRGFPVLQAAPRKAS